MISVKSEAALTCIYVAMSTSMLLAGHFLITLGEPNTHVVKAQYKREGEFLNEGVMELTVLVTVIYYVSPCKSM